MIEICNLSLIDLPLAVEHKVLDSGHLGMNWSRSGQESIDKINIHKALDLDPLRSGLGHSSQEMMDKYSQMLSIWII